MPLIGDMVDAAGVCVPGAYGSVAPPGGIDCAGSGAHVARKQGAWCHQP